jgi:hypothetical protein
MVNSTIGTETVNRSVRAAEVLEHAVLRVAAWPIESLEPFAAPALAAAADAIAAQGASAMRRGRALAATLYEAVAGENDIEVRRGLLALRRALYRGAGPLPPVPAGVRADLAAHLGREAAARQCLEDRRRQFEGALSAELDRQRLALRALTADPAFGRALAMDDPDLYRRWVAVAGRPLSGRSRHRRIEAAVLHHLTRAVSRPAPHGCWAGVAPVPGVPRRCVDITPDLRAFAWAFAVLCPDGRFDTAPASVWAALDDASGQLSEPHRTVWAVATRRARRLCEAMSRDFDELTPDHVLDRRAEIVAEVTKLWRYARYAGSPPEPLVHLDLRLPFSLAPDWDHLASAVAAVLAFHQGDGGAETYRQESLGHLASTMAAQREARLDDLLAAGAGTKEAPPAVPVDTRIGLLGRFRASPPTAVVEGCQAWEERLAGCLDDAEVVLGEVVVGEAVAGDGAGRPERRQLGDAPVPGPAGALLFGLDGAERLWAGWGRPQPGMFIGRFTTVIGTEAAEALRQRLGRWPVPPAELVGRDVSNLNASVRPALTPTRLVPDAELLVELDPGTRRGYVWSEGERLVPVYNSAAIIGGSDPATLLLRTLAMSHGWEFVAMGFPALEAERAHWGCLPRLVLADGTVLSPRRWTLGRGLIERVRGGGYLAWRAIVAERGLPDWLLVRYEVDPAAAPLLVRADSPLALSALLARVPDDTERLVITELPGNPATWPLVDDAGGHHRAEIAVTWFDDAYWQRAQPPAPVER